MSDCLQCKTRIGKNYIMLDTLLHESEEYDKILPIHKYHTAFSCVLSKILLLGVALR